MTTLSTTLRGRIIEPNRLGAMMRLARTVEQRGLRETAKAIGIGHATLMRIEHGEMFDVATWMKLQAWLLAPETEER